jgi:hypothetical protein
MNFFSKNDEKILWLSEKAIPLHPQSNENDDLMAG